MDITIKNWFELHRVGGMWFYANVEIYKDKTLKDNFICEIDMDCETQIENILDKLPKNLQDKKIEHVEFIRGNDCDGVTIALCIKE